MDLRWRAHQYEGVATCLFTLPNYYRPAPGGDVDVTSFGDSDKVLLLALGRVRGWKIGNRHYGRPFAS